MAIVIILLVAILLIAKHLNNNFEKPPKSYDVNTTNNKSEGYIKQINTIGNNNSNNTEITFKVLNPEAINEDLVLLSEACLQLEKYELLTNLGSITNSDYLTQEGIEKKELPIVCITDFCFYVEIANTDQLRQKGLSLRESLSNDSGMLFVFEESGHFSFWMKDMLFSLDMIWIGQDGKIIYIEKDTLPCGFECPTISPPRTEEFLSKYVLEVNAGLSEIYNFSIGDFVKIKI